MSMKMMNAAYLVDNACLLYTSRNIRVSTGGFYGTTRSSFLMEVPMEPKVSIIVPVYNAETVSYTHLDVYKRQHPMWAFMSATG